ncbi:hypothetical protein N7457_009562 [Penicillium paradoxum]|uniref:uncharacterized protein n=1 Tax=Penicillium paradoxum TaxID=176176 RepID=UPI0025474F74|nr:uncharacterized protein N7457_009562 [Penicillium paradoxum]KAJ5774666.1 hypothetical protein N7457_009562 [Penicillium paradoxum]
MAPPTESARSALSAFTCTLCNKSYSRHPEYEAHINSYDHQHKKRFQDLKQLSRDPNAAEKNRRAERKANAEAGLKTIEIAGTTAAPSGAKTGFKKGGFKSSFATIKGTAAQTVPAKRKNVLGDDDEDDNPKPQDDSTTLASTEPQKKDDGDMESDTDGDYGPEGYYDPRRPTDCFPDCAAQRAQVAA